MRASTLNLKVHFALCQTRHPGNIGSVARAMKVMNFDSLFLIEPHCSVDDQAFRLACHADDVLQNTRTLSSLSELITAESFVIGFCNRSRYQGPEHLLMPEGLENLKQLFSPLEKQKSQTNLITAMTNKAGSKIKEIVFVFGSENFGLLNSEVSLCDQIWQIPTFHDNYHSLNLAQAVQIVAYEIAKLFQGLSHRESTKESLSSSKKTAFETIDSFQGLEKVVQSLSTHRSLRSFLDKTRFRVV